VWESNGLEVVPLSWIDRKLQAVEFIDGSICRGSETTSADVVEYVIVGFFDVAVDRLEPLQSQSTRFERSRQFSVRARMIDVVRSVFC
jgi:hypothetical protein